MIRAVSLLALVLCSGSVDAFELTPRAHLAAGYLALFGDDVDRNELRLEQAELGLRWAWSEALALDVQVDAVRSASPESLFGIDGDALVLALARAYGEVALPLAGGRLQIRAGLVPDAVVELIEDGYGLRLVGPVLADRGGFYPRSDLALALAWDHAHLGVTLAASNGEGGHEVEHDDAKDLLALVRVDPWTGTLWGEPARLRIAAAYRAGTRGVAGVQNDRFTALVAWAHPRLSGGVEAQLAWGYAARADRDVAGLGAWFFGAPWPVLGVAARVDWLLLDTAIADSDRVVIDASLVLDVGRLVDAPANTMRLAVGWRGERSGGSAATVAGQPETSAIDAFVITLELDARHTFTAP